MFDSFSEEEVRVYFDFYSPLLFTKWLIKIYIGSLHLRKTKKSIGQWAHQDNHTYYKRYLKVVATVVGGKRR